MRNRARLIVGLGVLVLSPWIGSAAFGQEQEPPAEEPAAPAAEEQPAEAPSEDAQPKETKKRIGLYLAVAAGRADVNDINSSIVTRTEVDQTVNTFTLNDQMYARASIGWKLNNDKGDFRLDYRGYKEDTYELVSSGDSAKILEGLFATTPVPWWNLTVEDGQLTAIRTPQWWTDAFDITGPGGQPPNGRPDPWEIQSTDCSDPLAPFANRCRTVELTVPESLNNKVQTYDLLYGREFGRRRVSSRWWGGLRYFEYTGQITAPAWLMSQDFIGGEGYSDGTFLKMLLLEQTSEGWGPTGAWEVDFNFFDRRVVVYLRAQAAFLFSTLEVDTGPFITVVEQTDDGDMLVAEAQLTESREKSVWQTAGEIGIRFTMFRAFTIDVGYHRAGFLDSLILPAQIIVPEKEQTIGGGVSALYGTQDYKVGGWYAGLAIQF